MIRDPNVIRVTVVLSVEQAERLQALHPKVAPPKTSYAAWIGEQLEDAAYLAMLALVRQQTQAEELARLEASGQVEIGRSEQDIGTSGVWPTDGEAA